MDGRPRTPVESPRCPCLARRRRIFRRPQGPFPPPAIRLLVDSSGIGGIERHVAVLAGALRRRGYEARILLLAEHGDNPWLAQLAAEGLPFDVNRGGVSGLFACA